MPEPVLRRSRLLETVVRTTVLYLEANAKRQNAPSRTQANGTNFFRINYRARDDDRVATELETDPASDAGGVGRAVDALLRVFIASINFLKYLVSCIIDSVRTFCLDLSLSSCSRNASAIRSIVLPLDTSPSMCFTSANLASSRSFCFSRRARIA